MTKKCDNCIISIMPVSIQRQQTEMCEHKGVGHPDTLCDGAVEAAARALCRAYLDTYGEIRHFNVDKALLIGGLSAPGFGGGKLLRPIRLIIAGLVTSLPSRTAESVVEQAVRHYLSETLQLDSESIVIELALREGAPNLQRVINGRSAPLANDTSFGVGYAPYSSLEQLALKAAKTMRAPEFRAAFPAAGIDYKIMGHRIGDQFGFTVALAFVDRWIANSAEYFRSKEAVRVYLKRRLAVPCEIQLNALDDLQARDERGLYLTVTGCSAEHGDDGRVGRGNRINGLITPYRSMSLEAAAGKNPIAHVGKLYNVLANEMAKSILASVEGLDEVTVRLLSAIGRPVDCPQLISVDVVAPEGLSSLHRQHINEIVEQALSDLSALAQRLVHGSMSLF